MKAVSDFASSPLETAMCEACPYTCARHGPDVLGAGFVPNVVIAALLSDSGQGSETTNDV